MMKFLVFFVVFVLNEDVLSQPDGSSQAVSASAIAILRKNNNNIIKYFKDFNYDEYKKYLSNLLQADKVPTNQELDFPKSLTTSNYSLSDGAVTRFYEPMGVHGSFDNIIFHQLNKEFFGVTQVYGPKIEFSFKYTTNFQGSKKNGSLSLVVSHDPVEVQLDLGEKEGDVCTIDQKDNDVFFFYDEKLTLIPKFGPNSDQDAGKDLVKQMADAWLGELYRVIMNVKVERIVIDTKEKILKDSTFRKQLDYICTKIQ